MAKINHITHQKLVNITAQWASNFLKFPLVLKEPKCILSREIPDVLAFRANGSLLIECKMSREDFFADFKKPERCGNVLGLGNYRVYAAPEGLLEINDIPKKWGFIEITHNQKVIVKRLKVGNVYLDNDSNPTAQAEDIYFHMSDLKAERGMLYSCFIKSVPKNKIIFPI